MSELTLQTLKRKANDYEVTDPDRQLSAEEYNLVLERVQSLDQEVPALQLDTEVIYKRLSNLEEVVSGSEGSSTEENLLKLIQENATQIVYLRQAKRLSEEDDAGYEPIPVTTENLVDQSITEEKLSEEVAAKLNGSGFWYAVGESSEI